MDEVYAPEDIKTELNCPNVLLGYTKGKLRHNFNFLFTLGKKYIFNTKCKENRLNTFCFKNMVKSYYKIETAALEYDLDSLTKHTENGISLEI